MPGTPRTAVCTFVRHQRARLARLGRVNEALSHWDEHAAAPASPLPPPSLRALHALTPARPDGMMPPRKGPPMERRGNRLSRRGFVAGAGGAGLGLLAGCGRLPGQAEAPPAAARVSRLGFLSGNNPTAGAPIQDIF